MAIYILPFHANEIFYSILISCAWFIISVYLGFYEVYRYTKLIAILNCALKQFILFALFCLALELNYSELLNQKRVVLFVFSCLLIILSAKIFIYYFLRRYRILVGRNFRSVVLLGKIKNIEPLKLFFTDNPDYGYKLVKVFTPEEYKKEIVEKCLSFVLETKTDEIYCATANFTDIQIREIINFSDNNLKTLKFIPDKKQFLTHRMKFEYYDYIPVIPSRNILQDETINKMVKRIFDIVFSTIIIIGILSWLVPIMAIIIKLESRGPVFFIQKRNGLNYKVFNCYKFRSMEINNQEDIDLALINDLKITRVGKFIRKTSLDELPQFFNVFWSEMSVVGPRPHLWSQNKAYASKIKKYMVRHYVKPGITGLAQVKGFRGEIETEEDMVNRIKLDVFYIENWSMIMDFKIIFQTVINIFKGEDKAY